MDQYEAALCIQGYQNRFDDQREYLAYIAATIVNPHTKRRVVGDQIFKRPERTMQKTKVVSLEEIRARDLAAITELESIAGPIRKRSRKHRGGE